MTVCMECGRHPGVRRDPRVLSHGVRRTALCRGCYAVAAEAMLVAFEVDAGLRQPGGLRARHSDGDHNRTRVRAWFQTYPCGKQVECAAALGLTAVTVNRHVKAIRAEWRKPPTRRA